MPTKFISLLLATLMLTMALFCPREAGASSWYCVGKKCGERAWVCCRETAAENNKSCQVLPGLSLSVHRINVCRSSLHEANCDCAMVGKSATPRTIVGPSAIFAPEVASLSLMQAVLPTALMVCEPSLEAEGRAPPGKLSACTSSGLRAPPAFNTHFLLS